VILGDPSVWNKMRIFVIGLLALAAVQAAEFRESAETVEPPGIHAPREPGRPDVEDREVARKVPEAAAAYADPGIFIAPLPGSAVLTGYAPTVTTTQREAA
jgi:hypothetical protein